MNPLQKDIKFGSGFPTLLYKELLRFWKVAFQTVAAPVMTAMLYLLVFAHVLEDRVRMYDSVPYTAFLIPGLMMMSMLQNAFANPSSSLIQSRITGNLVFVLLPPLSHYEFFSAYVIAAVLRGLVVGLGIWIMASFFVPYGPPASCGCWCLRCSPVAFWPCWALSRGCGRKNSTSWQRSRIF